MEVLEPGNSEWWSLDKDCEKCLSRVRIVLDDLERRGPVSTPDGKKSEFCFDTQCEHCGSIIRLRENEVAKELWPAIRFHF